MSARFGFFGDTEWRGDRFFFRVLLLSRVSILRPVFHDCSLIYTDVIVPSLQPAAPSNSTLEPLCNPAPQSPCTHVPLE